MKKSERQILIKQIILNEDISTQEALLNKLREKDVKATQATISRDIKELNLIKTPGPNGETKYTLFQQNQLSANDRLKTTISDVVIKFTNVEFLNILTTLPGNAHVIGALLDELDMPEIVGTVAGNDTILIISPDANQSQKIFDYLNQYVRLSK